jgi:hypothetical protein
MVCLYGKGPSSLSYMQREQPHEHLRVPMVDYRVPSPATAATRHPVKLNDHLQMAGLDHTLFQLIPTEVFFLQQQ